MTGFEFVYNELYTHQISLEIWVDGSFLTEKINPEDCDIVLPIRWEASQQWTSEQRRVIDWIANDDLVTPYHCHSFVYYEYPESHPNYYEGVWMRAYWTRQYGFSRENAFKGIVIITT